jgi:hypothetical protein
VVLESRAFHESNEVIRLPCAPRRMTGRGGLTTTQKEPRGEDEDEEWQMRHARK